MAKYKYSVSTADNAPETAPILLKGSITDNLILAAKLGYEAIEIHLRENSKINYPEILRTCEDNNIGISAIVTGRLATQEHVSLTDHNEGNARKAVEGLKRYIDIASIFKTDIIIGWIRGSIPQDILTAAYEEILADKLKILSQYAISNNVKIHIEAINRYEINSLNSAEAVLGIIDRYDLENIYVHLDTFHMNIEEHEISNAILLCKEKLGYVHFADSNRRYPGLGHIDFDSVAKALETINYQGFISVECLPFPNSITAAKNALLNCKLIMRE